MGQGDVGGRGGREGGRERAAVAERERAGVVHGWGGCAPACSSRAWSASRARVTRASTTRISDWSARPCPPDCCAGPALHVSSCLAPWLSGSDSAPARYPARYPTRDFARGLERATVTLFSALLVADSGSCAPCSSGGGCDEGRSARRGAERRRRRRRTAPDFQRG
eukprot:3057762-Rhodomonas_salina.1